MARARNIKPGFYKNEDLAECSVWARFIFPGLWMLADREGRLEDRPKRIKGELLPFDSQDVEPLLRELAQNKFLERYEVDGERFIQITKFRKHQSPHYSEKKSVIKPPPLSEIKPDIHPPNSGSSPVIKEGSQPPDSLIPDSPIPESRKRLSPAPQAQGIADANPAALELDGEQTSQAITRANGSAPDCPYSAIAEAYHQELPELPTIVVLTPQRKRTLQARWREVCTAEHFDAEQGVGFFRDFFRRIKSSDFLLGKAPPKRPGERTFRADFDWIFNPANFIKIVEGRYQGRRH